MGSYMDHPVGHVAVPQFKSSDGAGLSPPTAAAYVSWDGFSADLGPTSVDTEFDRKLFLDLLGRIYFDADVALRPTGDSL